MTDFDRHADFLTIYIREAHPVDERYVVGQKGTSDIYQYSTIDERISEAKSLERLRNAVPSSPRFHGQ